MRVQVQKWGNSLALRIPKPFAEDAGVKEGTTVQLSVADGRLVAQAVRPSRIQLKDLLAAIKKSNIHREFRTGKPSGRETW